MRPTTYAATGVGNMLPVVLTKKWSLKVDENIVSQWLMAIGGIVVTSSNRYLEERI